MQAAAVAGALKRVDDRMGLEPGELGQTQRKRLLHFAANRETPVPGIEFARFVHVITYEEVGHRGEPGIEIFDRSFEIDEAE